MDIPKFETLQPGKNAIRRTDNQLLEEAADSGSDTSNLLEVMAHPVTKVYCDELGIIRLERLDTNPIILGMGSPKRSRKVALQRCDAVLEQFKGQENHPQRNFTISDLGRGLTFNQLRQQTVDACLESRKIEAERKERFEAKRRKYGV